MALTRKFLAAMGLESEKIEEIIQAHADTVSALNEKIDAARGEADKANKEVEKLTGVQEAYNALKAKVDEEKEARKGKDYDKLLKEYEDYKAEVERKAARSAKEAAYREILKDAGIPEKHFAKILKYSDVDGVELDDKGKATKAKDILSSIKEEWSDHIEKTKTEGAITPTPPKNEGGSKKTKADIMAIKDRAERQAAISENHELFGY